MYQVQKRISGKKTHRKMQFEKEPVLKNLPKVEVTPHHWEKSPVSSPTTPYEKENIKEFGSPKKEKKTKGKGKTPIKEVKEEKEKTPVKEKTPSPKQKEKTPSPKQKEKRKTRTKKEKEIKVDLSNEEKIDYNKLKIPELKLLLKNKGLKVSGNKAELIARLSGKEVPIKKGEKEKEEKVGKKGEKEKEKEGKEEKGDYSKLKIPELKELLKGHGLRVSGNKSELIARLVVHDKEKGKGGKEEDEEEKSKNELRVKYNKMTVNELKVILSGKGISRTGKKAELIEKLVNTKL